MRQIFALLPVLFLIAAPAHAQAEMNETRQPEAQSPADSSGMSEIELTDISPDELDGATVETADGEEIGRVSSIIPAEDGIDSVLVNVGSLTGTADEQLAFHGADLTALRSDKTGEIRFVTPLTADEVAALAVSSN